MALQDTATSFAPVGRPSESNLRKTYLLTYNLLSGFAWAWVLERVIRDLLWDDENGLLSVINQPSLFFYLEQKPNSFGELLSRASEVHGKCGRSVLLIQSFAILEVFHALFKLTRSGLLTTAMQVSSRLWIVWVILPSFPTVGKSPIYASMVAAWSVTEVIRYAHYALGLAGIKSGLLEWLRYSTFYVLYPIGAGSEASIMYLAYQAASQAGLGKLITNVIFGLVCLWPPALTVMMSHMTRQRKKYLRQRNMHKKSHTASTTTATTAQNKKKPIKQT